MPIENLTDRRLRGLTFEAGEIVDRRSGLSARADRAGKVTLSFRYRFGRTRPRIFLGSFPTLALADARIEAGKIREAVRHGRDPQGERRSASAQAEMNVDGLCDLFITRYAKSTKASWQADQQMLAFDVRPRWGERAAASISRRDAIQLLFAVAERAPVQANRLRALLSKLFSWSLDNDLLPNNPMAGVKRPTVEGDGRTRVLADGEFRALWHALGRIDVVPGARAALRMLMLVGQRSGEVAGATLGEFHDLDDPGAARWEIPASRMKARKPHIVPIVGLTRDIVRAELERPRAAEFVLSASAVPVWASTPCRECCARRSTASTTSTA